MQPFVNVVRAIDAGPPARELRGIVLEAAASEELADRFAHQTELTLKLSGDRELRRLNREFLGHDEVTDVLAFPGVDAYLGDLVVSWPAVRRQARQFGHTDGVELRLLVVHGLMHLLGWDHATEQDEAEMSRVTRAVLARSGVELAPARL